MEVKKIKENPFRKMQRPNRSSSNEPRFGITGRIMEISPDGSFILIEDARGEREIETNNLGRIKIMPWNCVLRMSKSYIDRYGDALANINIGDVYGFGINCRLHIDEEVGQPMIRYGIRYIGEVKTEKEDAKEVAENISKMNDDSAEDDEGDLADLLDDE